MTDLAAWLLEQIAEDEADAKESLPGPWRVTVRPVGVADGRWVITSRHDPKCVAELLDYGADRRMAYHIARHNPARVLAEGYTRRRIVEVHQPQAVPYPGDRAPESFGCTTCHKADDATHGFVGGGYCETLRLLALPYADRPGYLEEWRPE